MNLRAARISRRRPTTARRVKPLGLGGASLPAGSRCVAVRCVRYAPKLASQRSIIELCRCRCCAALAPKAERDSVRHRIALSAQIRRHSGSYVTHCGSCGAVASLVRAGSPKGRS